MQSSFGEYENYLLFAMSTPSNRNKMYCKGESKGVFSSAHVDGMQTNVGPSKYLQAVLADEKEQFSKIVMLCSKEVEAWEYDDFAGFPKMTAISYYKAEIRDHAQALGIMLPENDDDVFQVIPYGMDNVNDVDGILKTVLGIASATSSDNSARKKRLYIDFTGGLRTAAMSLVFAARFAAKQGIEIAGIFYANLSRGAGSEENPISILDCTEIYKTFDWIDILHEIERGASINLLEKKAKEMNSEKLLVFLNNARASLVARKAGMLTGAETLSFEADDSSFESIVVDMIKKELEKGNLEQIEAALAREDGISFNMLKENLMTLLEDEGKLTYIGTIKKSSKEDAEPNGIPELIALHIYYGTYIKYVQAMIRALKDSKKSPLAFWKEYKEQTYNVLNKTKEVLEKWKDRRSRKNTTHTNVTDDMAKNRDYSSALNKLSRDFANSLEKQNRNNANMQQLTDDFVMEYSALRYAFFASGFPFECVVLYGDRLSYSQARWWCKKEYQAVLETLIHNLGRMYQKESVHYPFSFINIFKYLGNESMTYDEFIDALSTDSVSDELLRILSPFRHCSFTSNGTSVFASKKWSNDKEISAFLHELLPVYNDVREIRNKLTHTVITQEQIQKGVACARKLIALIKK